MLPFRPARFPYPALDYSVPLPFSSEAQRGKRAAVNVKGRSMEGLILDVFPLKESKFQNLKPIKALFPLPALEEGEIRELEKIAQFFGGRLANTLNLALPARVQYVEKEPYKDRKWSRFNEEALSRLVEEASRLYSGFSLLPPSLSCFKDQSFVWDLAQQRGRIVKDLALLGLLSKKLGYSFLACLPSERLFKELGKAFSDCGLDPVFAGSGLGAAENYRSFLACCRPGALALGTRRAMYLPLKGPCVMVDVNSSGPGSTDGMSPYANVRDVLSIRHEGRGGIRISMAYCHAVEQEKWLEEGSASHIFPSSPPPIRPACFSRDRLLEMGERFLHLPSLLVREVRKNGREGKKSLLVCPARSETSFFLCPKCGTFMKCGCGGSLKSKGGGIFCPRCGKKEAEWGCPKCSFKAASSELIALKRGPERIREELEGLLKEEELKNVEISTASSLPQRGYSLVAILDAWLSFFSLHLDAESNVLNLWMEAASLASEKVFLIGECQKELLSSFEGWNSNFPKWELEERKKAGLPPFKTAVNIWGREKEIQKAVEELLKRLKVARGESEVMGPMAVPNSEDSLCVLFLPRSSARDLGKALFSLSHPPSPLHVHFWIDPYCFDCR